MNPFDFHLNWKGDQVAEKVQAAEIAGLNDTAAACVTEAKNNHPGWNNVTSTAEGSVAIWEPARRVGTFSRVIWGSRGVKYVIWLELKHGSFLRNAADKVYPSLQRRIKAHLSL